jgi:hypothetical protein
MRSTVSNDKRAHSLQRWLMPPRTSCALWRTHYLCSISQVLMLPSRTSPLDQFDASILDDNLGCHTYHTSLSGFSSCHSALLFCHHMLACKASWQAELKAQDIGTYRISLRKATYARITSVCGGIQWHGWTRPRSVRTRPQWMTDYHDSKRDASWAHLNNLKLTQTCVRVGLVKQQ